MFSLPVWFLRVHGVDLVAVIVAAAALQRLTRTYSTSHGQSEKDAARPIESLKAAVSEKLVLADLAPVPKEVQQAVEQHTQPKSLLYWAVLMVAFHLTAWATVGSVWPLQTDADGLSGFLIAVLPFLLSLAAIYVLISIFVLNTINWQEDPHQQPEAFKENLRRNMLYLAVGSPLFAVFVVDAFSAETLLTRPWAGAETAIHVTQACVWLYFVRLSKESSDRQRAGARS